MLRLPGYHLNGSPRTDSGKYLEVPATILADGLKAGQEARLFPGALTLRIKSITPLSSDRCLLSVKGVPRAVLKPGAVLTAADWPVTEGREALFLSNGFPAPQHPEVLFGGPCPEFNRETLVGRAEFQQEGHYILARFPKPFPLLPAAVYTLAGASRILILIFPGRPKPALRRKLESITRAPLHSPPSSEEIYLRLLHLQGFVFPPPPLMEEIRHGGRRVGRWLVLEDVWKTLKTHVIKLAREPGGLSWRNPSSAGYPKLLIQDTVTVLISDGVLIDRSGWIFPPGEPPLSPLMRSLLETARSAGAEGVRVRTLTDEVQREAFAGLERTGLLRGGTELYLESGIYKELARRLLQGRRLGERISMPTIRKTFAGSRPATLEILTLMEADGLLGVEKDGRERRVLTCLGE